MFPTAMTHNFSISVLIDVKLWDFVLLHDQIIRHKRDLTSHYENIFDLTARTRVSKIRIDDELLLIVNLIDNDNIVYHTIVQLE